MNKAISTEKAPGAVGPYSQAIQTGNMIFVSGQLPLVPGTPDFAGDNVTEQTHQSLKNMKAILEEAGFKMSDVVKTTCLLDNITDFAAMNEVYAQYFTEPFPARAAFAVDTLPKNALVEIEAVAAK